MKNLFINIIVFIYYILNFYRICFLVVLKKGVIIFLMIALLIEKRSPALIKVNKNASHRV